MQGDSIMAFVPLFFLIVISILIIVVINRRGAMKRKNLWYYKKGDKEFGPLSGASMRELLENDQIPPGTPVRTQNSMTWQSAKETVLSGEQSVTQGQSDINSDSETELPIVSGTESEIKKPHVRPWVRYFARQLDYMIFGLIVGLIIPIVYPQGLQWDRFLLAIVIMILWVFVEAFLLSTWGTTPGKCLLRTRIVTATGNKLSFSEAISRSLLVWMKGVGLGIPFVAFVTMIIAYGKLTRDGATSWDVDGGFIVTHNRIGAARVLITIVLFAFFLFLISKQNAGP